MTLSAVLLISGRCESEAGIFVFQALTDRTGFLFFIQDYTGRTYITASVCTTLI